MRTCTHFFQLFGGNVSNQLLLNFCLRVMHVACTYLNDKRLFLLFMQRLWLIDSKTIKILISRYLKQNVLKIANQ